VLLAAAVLLTVLQLRKERPVITCGEFSMTNTQLGYYYWSEFFYFADAYGDWLGDTVDWTVPLDQQAYDADRSWQDYLLEETLAVVTETESLVLQAQADGFVLSNAEEAAFEALWSELMTDAGDDPQAYLRQSFGRYADVDSYRQHLYHMQLAAAYADHLYADITLTEDEIAAYARRHGGEYLDAGLEEALWAQQAEADLLAETYDGRIRAICGSYAFLVDYDAIVLTPPDNLYQT